MKIYMGLPGVEPLVTVTDKGATAQLPGPHGWGTAKLGGNSMAPAIPHRNGNNTAKQILSDLLGDEMEAARLSRRFQYRALNSLPPDAPWTMTEIKVQGIVTEIADAEKATAGELSRVVTAPAPVANEGGRAVGVAVNEMEKDGRPISKLEDEK